MVLPISNILGRSTIANSTISGVQGALSSSKLQPLTQSSRTCVSSSVSPSTPLATTSRNYYNKGKAWSREHEQYTLKEPEDIVSEKRIFQLLEKSKSLAKDPQYVKALLKKAHDVAMLKNVRACELKDEFVQGLTQEEIACLLNVDWHSPANKELKETLFNTALEVKESIYGNRIVLFTPLYTASYCSCLCNYCGYNAESDHHRIALTNEEVRREAETIARSGHKRVLMLCGEHSAYPFERFLEAVETVKDTTIPNPVTGEDQDAIRRINVEIPVLSVTDIKRLKNTDKIGTYSVFQETYHRPTYKKAHIAGPKADYDYRLTAMDRAQLGGIDDNGIGVLFGLYDWKFEVLAMMLHAEHLDTTYGAGPHTISIPRIQPAKGAPMSEKIPYPVSDEDFKILVALIRLAVPYTGMILSTRETSELRRELLQLGVSQLSAGSRTDPGSYTKAAMTEEKSQGKGVDGQFELSDERTVDEVIQGLIADGFMPSECTACYGKGRTGEVFMSQWAKTGKIKSLCGPNAMYSLSEYLEDFATPRTRTMGWKAIRKAVGELPEEVQGETVNNLLDIMDGDLRNHCI